MRKYLFFVFVLLLFSGCATENVSPLTVTIYNDASDAIGTAVLTEEGGDVTIELSVEGLSPGYHGIHIHEYGACDPPDFETAGSHYNPEDKKHGLLHPEGAHMGDLPNILVDDDGSAEAELVVRGASLTDGKYSLLEGDGTSIVIHEDPDDGLSQPAGDAGRRIACGKITLSNQENDEAEEEPTDPSETEDEEEEED
ncbi:Cu-Zn family superoxide dismutase [Natronobacillus azotifigens]|uniref:Superoxide dismutase [Cu-Zn] n=1 Tax=Natronobacillus azotifigens TaxID=472978 RepID=A0A9J6RFQ3_9BACI|nr:superoxide dismutase family protein [Natronobacillus azotifigens]MCZ0704253.1 superoxide dismutase family protein [Natronobacillus azotifigens]